ncbi:MAG TPA: hypothetical protein DCQ34_06145 [Chitinophagaceae bacterium]|nr:hypothetical protein [Chitinophagaceae bacterium]HCY90484.1 hypothetical protein [Chitinophagaceae bacterium]HRF25779.1 metal-dependent hydrolase [Ferruginibacter sp.]
MFIGHFAAGFAAKKADSSVSLGWTFFAAQWLDLLWPVLLLTGTEHVELAAGKDAPVPLSFTHYPISHSLLVVAGWALLIGLLYYFLKRNKRGAILVGMLVLSHWLLDFIVHIPDLPLAPFSEMKTGMGLWNYKWVSFGIEMLLFAAGFMIYLEATKAINQKGNWILYSLAFFLLLIHCMNVFGPPPADTKPIAWVGLSQWLLVFWAYKADANRKARTV